MAKQIFVNLPVKDLNKTKEFFSRLGFTFNPQFTDKNAACMIIGKNMYAMLLVEKFFKTFTADKEISDAKRSTEVLNALSVGSREEVDEMKELMKTPEAMKEWFENKKKEFDTLPEGNNKMNPVVHFEMPYENKDRMAEFYTKAFGWHMRKLGEEMGNYVLATTTETDGRGPKETGRINGGFFPKRDDRTVQLPSVVIAVDDIKEAINKVTDSDGKVLGEPMEIPDVGQYVSFLDTEGNRVSMLQPIPKNWHASKSEKQ